MAADDGAARQGGGGALLDGEIQTLDRLIDFLRGAEPWFQTLEAGVDASVAGPAGGVRAESAAIDARAGEGGQRHDTGAEHLVFAVCGNWYDLPHKAPALASIAKQEPSAEFLLAGGREERLTPQEAVELGGEPLLLQRALRERFGIRASRTVVYTGSRVTNHNLRLILHYVKQVHEFTGRATRLRLIEEGFLVRREAASLAAQLREDAAAASLLVDVRFVPVGPRTFRGLAAVHGGREDIALALVLGELSRLHRYQRPGAASTATHGLVHRGAVLDAGALDALDPSLAEQLAALQAWHAEGLLAEGRRVLEELPREEMLRLATPIQELPAGGRLHLRGGLAAVWPAAPPLQVDPRLVAVAGCLGLAVFYLGVSGRLRTVVCRARGVPP